MFQPSVADVLHTNLILDEMTSMIGRFFKLLYGSEPVVFRSALSSEQAIAPLRAATRRPGFRLGGGSAATGVVSMHMVELKKETPFVRNDFKPCFVGRFRMEGEEVVLEGGFTLSWQIRFFMTMIFLFLAYFFISIFAPGSPTTTSCTFSFVCSFFLIIPPFFWSLMKLGAFGVS